MLTIIIFDPLDLNSTIFCLTIMHNVEKVTEYTLKRKTERTCTWSCKWLSFPLELYIWWSVINVPTLVVFKSTCAWWLYTFSSGQGDIVNCYVSQVWETPRCFDNSLETKKYQNVRISNYTKRAVLKFLRILEKWLEKIRDRVPSWHLLVQSQQQKRKNIF